MSRFVCSKTWLWLTDSHICTWTFMLTLWLNDPVTHTVIYIQCLSHTHSHTLMRPIWREAGLWCSEPLRESAVFSRFFSMNLCVSRRFGITWDMSHVPSRRRPLNFCKACENLSCHWSGLVFTLLWIVLKSPVCSQEEPEGMASASGISHSAVTLPQLSLPPVKGHGGQWPRWGSGTAGRHALFSSSLLMCGLACFNWHVALQELACRLLVLRC